MADVFGYAYVDPSNSRYQQAKPTVDEQVPLAYQPQPVPLMVYDQPAGIVAQHLPPPPPPGQRHNFCFGGGTPVQTLDGPRRIEDLRAGDEVLTQNPRTGELKYQPLVAVFHNPPNATLRIELENDESIVATGIHRLWKAGRGWVMARELQPGDRLRTLGGLAPVKSVRAEQVQPVYNLQVAEGESFFVGRTGVLAHDNSLVQPVTEPFDAVPALGGPSQPPLPGR